MTDCGGNRVTCCSLSLSLQLSPGLGPSMGNRSELEGRFHELTESLIQKQTTIEALTAEKHSLNVQIQRLRVSLRWPDPSVMCV